MDKDTIENLVTKAVNDVLVPALERQSQQVLKEIKEAINEVLASKTTKFHRNHQTIDDAITNQFKCLDYSVRRLEQLGKPINYKYYSYRLNGLIPYRADPVGPNGKPPSDMAQ